MHEDVEDVTITARPERATSDLESSGSSGYIKRLDDSQITDEDDFEKFEQFNPQRRRSNCMMVQKQVQSE